MNYISILAVPVMICGIIAFGLVRRVKVYDCFVEGAKDGLESIFRIIVPLIGLIVAVSMFRASGALELFTNLLSPLTNLIRLPRDVVPLALLKPVSGSGSIALVNDILQNSGPDSLSGRIASVMAGSTETTFYVLTVYFGAVGIKNFRYALACALLADLVGMVASVAVVFLMFKY